MLDKQKPTKRFGGQLSDMLSYGCFYVTEREVELAILGSVSNLLE